MRIPRRHFLRGSGALLAVPLLESLLPRAARAQAAPPKRILFWIQDNGTLRDEWSPQRAGSGWTLPFVLSPLEPVKNDVVVVSGIDNHLTFNHRGNGHNIGNATLLTAIARTDFDNVGDGANAGGPSIDQYLAGRLPTAPRRSINIQMPTGTFAITYRDRQQPEGGLPLYNAFQELFGNLNGTTTPEVLERRRRTRESVIDAVLENFKHVDRRVSVDDKRKLDHHVSLLRDLEVRLALEAQGQACAPDGSAPTYRPGRGNNEHAAYLYALAFACQLSHVGTFMMDGPSNEPTFPVRFTGGDYHNWIHQGPDYGLDPVRRREDWRQSMRYFAQGFAALVSRFKSTPDTQGTTLLDNSLLVWANTFGMGSYHDFNEIPFVVAGRAQGAVSPGRWLDYRRSRAANPTRSTFASFSYLNETTNNLYVSLCKAMGFAEVTTFGEPTFCTGGLAGFLG